MLLTANKIKIIPHTIINVFVGSSLKIFPSQKPHSDIKKDIKPITVKDTGNETPVMPKFIPAPKASMLVAIPNIIRLLKLIQLIRMSLSGKNASLINFNPRRKKIVKTIISPKGSIKSAIM